MKIIDLLNKIAKGEEVPEKIRFFGEEFKLDENEYYSVHSSSPFVSYFGEDYLRAELNSEIEIIEEVEDKEYEDIEEISYKYVNTYGNISQHRKSEEPLIDTINALIKNQKYILERINRGE